MRVRHIPDRFTPAEIDSIVADAFLTPEQLQRSANDGRAGRYALASAKRRLGRIRYAPPKVTRGESIPDALVVMDGEAKIEPGRRGWGGDASFIDWINFTCDETSFAWTDSFGVLMVGPDGSAFTPDQIILECSSVMESIFGYGITTKRDRGANFYERSYELGEGVGMVCHGGQRGTVLISVSGSGLMAAKSGWEHRLYEFLETKANRPRITRCDLAYDDLEGVSYSVDQADKDHDAGYFNCGGRNPDIEHRGNWKKPNGKGRTLYVGNRKNGKYLRCYEKGKQLGNPESPWVRIEVELKAVDRIIPHDVVLKAGQYLAATYPALAFIKLEQIRIATVKKTAQTTYQKMLDWLKHQAGASLWFALEMEGDANKLLQKIMREGVIPKRVQLPDYLTMAPGIHLETST